MGENGNDADAISLFLVLQISRFLKIMKSFFPDFLGFFFLLHVLYLKCETQLDLLAEYLAVAVEAAKSAGEVRNVEREKTQTLVFLKFLFFWVSLFLFFLDFQVIQKGFYQTKNVEHKGLVINSFLFLIFLLGGF